MAQPQIKRYALVGGSGDDGIRRFHLARLEVRSRRTPSRQRLERMEEVAARQVRTGSPRELPNLRTG